MGRKKTPPPLANYKLGDRVIINNNAWQQETGIISRIMLTGQGRYQNWVYYIKTHEKYPSRYQPSKNVRYLLRCYENHLVLLKRKNSTLVS